MTLINRQSEGIAYAESPGQSLSGKSFNETFIQCLDLYKTLTIHVLEKSNLDIEEEADIDFKYLLDEFGRLRIWGEQTKASLAPNARGSLDDFLRNEERLRQEVQEVLGQLETQLSLAVSVAKEACQQHPTPDDDVSDRMTSDSDCSSENGSEDNIHYGSARPKVSKLSIIVSHIFEHVQLLYHFGSLLRRPGLKGRYLRHNDSNNQNIATIFDLRHIEEKLRQWYQEAGEGLNVSPEEEKAVTEQTISKRLADESECNFHYVLSRRFAKANAQRREQLKYWVNNPYQLDRSQEPKINKVMGKSPIGKAAIQQKSKEDDAGTGDGTSTIQPESKGPRSEKSRSTLISFSTVAESAFLETGTETGKPRTIYAESVVAGKWSTRVPPPPNRETIIDGVRQYKCPYCYMDLDAWIMQDRLAWKRHVFRDLRPYSCTFADCADPNKLYTTRHEWKYHEMQIHRRSWVCHGCNRNFQEKDALIQHLRNSHLGNWTDRQLSVILEMSERPMDESIILPCPLCKSELSLAKLLDHLAAHMEEISLFVLPNNLGLEDTDSNDAMGTDTQKSSDDGEPSSLSSLRFSDIALSDRDVQGVLGGEDLCKFKNTPGYDPSLATLPSGQDDSAQVSARLRPPQANIDIASVVKSNEGLQDVVKEDTGASSSVSHVQLDPTLVRPLDIDSIIDRLLAARLWLVHLTNEEIRYLCSKAKDVLISQPALLELVPPLKICGDIQGQYRDLLQVFELCEFPPVANYLFMGNYVDGQGQSIETICLLLAYKVKYPENFFLLRGSHEIQTVNRKLGFYAECRERYDVSLWRDINDVFNYLPFAAIVDDKILVVHGGLSPDLNSMEDIRRITRPNFVFDSGLPHDLLRTNPRNDITGWAKDDRDARGSLVFGPDVVSRFLQKHDLDLICRAHEVVKDGFELFAKKQLVTIFSAPNYRNQHRNSAAVFNVDESLKCEVQILKPAGDIIQAGRRRSNALSIEKGSSFW